MFQRVGASAYKKDLSNTIALLHALDNPEKNLVCIHIAGTNGKGSTSHLLASIFQEAGLKTGLYTSPHLVDFRERIRINGDMIPEEFVRNFTLKNIPIFDKIQPSFFEMTVAMAFDYFKQNKIDIAIIETGMGGRLDSTNVINPLASIITNIGFDHTAFLGESIELIAAEKAGIIKENTPVIISEKQPKSQEVFEQKARALNAPIYFAEDYIQILSTHENYPLGITEYSIDSPIFKGSIHLPLMGTYQQKNIKGVLTCLQVLKLKFPQIKEQHIKDGLENVKRNTGLKGRWEIIHTQPLAITDTGHNKDGMIYILEQLQKLTYEKLFMVIGMVNDKDVRGIMAMLPKNAFYIFTQAAIPRALDATELANIANEFSLKGTIIYKVSDAYEYALEQASESDLIFIGGSTFVAAEVV